MEPEDARCTPAMQPPERYAGETANSSKEGIGRNMSYIAANAPEKSVVLSPRLEELISRVGGCQTEQVAAVIQRVMYEILSQQKGRY